MARPAAQSAQLGRRISGRRSDGCDPSRKRLGVLAPGAAGSALLDDWAFLADDARNPFARFVLEGGQAVELASSVAALPNGCENQQRPR